jgi:hypothetical protein
LFDYREIRRADLPALNRAASIHKKGPPNGDPGGLVEAAGIEPGALDDAEICVDIR